MTRSLFIARRQTMNRIVGFALAAGISVAVLSSTLLVQAESTGDRAALARALQGAWLPLESEPGALERASQRCSIARGFCLYQKGGGQDGYTDAGGEGESDDAVHGLPPCYEQ